ncbi:MAG: ATP-binding cassette domain-containing protein [Candidatus Lokiarchaeota archaeon]|nr:ATP-binding cassette domain-containing protein [Candidatus Lokiarchaeota archaeon]MBD3200818.1 ATP-binding cassette domain-containing protein [Candidatus Lokiarchaeota archaeon]
MKNSIIKTENLSKEFKLKGKNRVIKALNNINIEINDGEIFGLLGPNGAGKTTLIKILTTISQPTSGGACVGGYDVIKEPKKVKPLIGLMLEGELLYYRITGYDNLKFFCKIYKVPNYDQKIKAIAKEFGLNKWLNEYVGKFSSGMKMKLALARTLLLDRDILFLDEPTLGLDVKSIDMIVNKLKNLNRTIFMTSHDMNVVEKLCDRIAFIINGEILKIGEKEEIKKLSNDEVRINVTLNNHYADLRAELEQTSFIKQVTYSTPTLKFILEDRTNFNDLISILGKYDIRSISEKQPTLEELFLSLLNHNSE